MIPVNLKIIVVDFLSFSTLPSTRDRLTKQ